MNRVISMKPLIGIVGRIDETNDNYVGTMIPEEYLKAIKVHGGNAMGILMTTSYDEIDEDVIKKCDGIFFIGGTIMKDCHFKILNVALKHKIPILGICLGMQIIGCNSTSERIIKDVDNHQTLIAKEEDKYELKHSVIIEKGTRLHQILNVDSLMVNSRHRKQIIKVDYPYVVSARSKEGTIEAIELDDKQHFVLGVQWHPETMLNQDKIFEEFIKEASLKQQKTLQK